MALLCCQAAQAQGLRLKGVVSDAGTGEPVIGAVVKVMDMVGGTTTDLDGRFDLAVDRPPPFKLTVIFFGYSSKEQEVKRLEGVVQVKMTPDAVLLQDAQVVRQRISDKQKQAPLTVESMDLLAIKEVAGGDFYEGLGNLKGVDMTAASFGFKVINTRGFNSTSPVRSLQLIDGVDNQSPGLNFSLGNFLGASDLDVLKVDVIAGASTAFYGPGAFNGVIDMTTKSPWNFPGLSTSVKLGERNMVEAAVRWAEILKPKEGPAHWAYKVNAYALRADDWPAENYAPTENSPTGTNNPGGYDAVNIYGDEDVSTNNNYLNSNTARNDYPGLGKFLRNGYKESDLVDYNTFNVKLGGSLHYRIADSVEFVAASNFSTGSTVYQGDNRYRLKDIKFFQHRLEVGKKGTWFLRGYVTHEDAGKTYDIYTTALRLQDAQGSTKDWNTQYQTLWGQGNATSSWIGSQVVALPDYITANNAAANGLDAQTWPVYQDQFVQDNFAIFQAFHQAVTDSVNSLNTSTLDPFYVPGTDRFNAKFDEITNKRFTDGGSLFFDKSVLAHVAGEYKFKPKFGVITVGGNFRQYMPNSAGTIFRDTGDVKIRNSEFGLVAGLEKKFMNDKLTGTATVRMDKNENFNVLFSPAVSLVYANTPAHVWRVGFSSAIRNPTLADQYLYYNVGRALLLGNVDGQFEAGRDSMFTISSFNNYRDTPPPGGLLQGLTKLDYFNVDRLRPEQVKTIEAGYRGTHWENVYLDLGAYNSWYTDFIGYIIGLHAQFDPANGFPIGGLQAFRVAANATSQVVTRGVNAGFTWYRPKLTYTFNYSFNQLTTGADDPIIPAFNTPQNKFNAGLNARDRKIPFTDLKRFGYGVNWKFVEGFTFEGSPQFTGPIPSYDMVDAQINVKFSKPNITLKLGASNLFGFLPLWDKQVPDGERIDRALNNDVYLVYGGPRIGRLAYLQISYDLVKL
ncbi:MAG: TonB-dependent receptor [Flavobacteriales bacterium]|nr:TonB-dependent receptor [Flavobacteriales bacterium]